MRRREGKAPVRKVEEMRETTAMREEGERKTREAGTEAERGIRTSREIEGSPY